MNKGLALVLSIICGCSEPVTEVEEPKAAKLFGIYVDEDLLYGYGTVGSHYGLTQLPETAGVE